MHFPLTQYVVFNFSRGLNPFFFSPFFLLTVPRRCFFCGSFLLFMFHVCFCYAVLSVPCSLLITCWERTGHLSLLCVMLSCLFVTFPYGDLFRCCSLFASIPDLAFFFTISKSWRRVVWSSSSSSRGTKARFINSVRAWRFPWTWIKGKVVGISTYSMSTVFVDCWLFSNSTFSKYYQSVKHFGSEFKLFGNEELTSNLQSF